MTIDELREFVLSFPETTEEPHFDRSSFRVKGKILITVPPDGSHIHLVVGADELPALLAEDPAAFEEILWGKRVMTDWVRVHLDVADDDVVRELVEDAWRMKAPKRVLAAYDAHR